MKKSVAKPGKERWDTPETEALLGVVISLKTLTEAKDFFRDLLTEGELMEFGNRWKAAQLLAQKVPYKDIERETGLSSTTVARVAWWLKKGKGGYRRALGKMTV